MEEIFLTDRVRSLAPRIKEFIANELVPLETTEFLTSKFSKIEPILRQKRELVKKAGLWGLQWSEAAGGLGLNLCEFGQISELLAWNPFGHYVFNCQAPDIGNMELMHRFAPKALQDKYLESLKNGEIRSCFSMTEPQFAGSNPTNLGTTAVKDGDHYVINGHKWFTSSADGAAFAIVMAITNPDAAPHKRASQILVPTNAEGFKFIRNIPIMGEDCDGWMGHAEIVYENVRVPLKNLIGNEGEGFLLAQERLGPGRIHHCMRWIGTSERAFDIMCRRAVERNMGDGSMLADKQFVHGWIAESRAEIDAARLMVLRTAYNIDKFGAAAVRNQISSIKFLVANTMLRVVDRAIQANGARGMTDDILLSFYYRHERGARIYDGADEVHKQALARSILKQYA